MFCFTIAKKWNKPFYVSVLHILNFYSKTQFNMLFISIRVGVMSTPNAGWNQIFKCFYVEKLKRAKKLLKHWSTQKRWVAPYKSVENMFSDAKVKNKWLKHWDFFGLFVLMSKPIFFKSPLHMSCYWILLQSCWKLDMNTIGIWIPDVSGIQMVENRLDMKWSGFQMVDHSKTGRFDFPFSNVDQYHSKTGHSCQKSKLQ